MYTCSQAVAASVKGELYIVTCTYQELAITSSGCSLTETAQCLCAFNLNAIQHECGYQHELLYDSLELDSLVCKLGRKGIPLIYFSDDIWGCVSGLYVPMMQP